MPMLSNGFTTRIKFMNSVILCTSFDFTDSNTIMESQGAYTGTKNDAVTRAIGNPYLLDYSESSGSFSYEPTETLATNLVAWVNDRNSAKALEAKTNDGTLLYDECYFNSISFTASEGNLLSASVDVYAVNRPLSNTVGGATIRENALDTSLLFPNGIMVVPYWKTKILWTGVTQPTDTLSWTLTFNQDLVKKFFCKHSADITAPAPDYVLAGLLTCDLEATFLLSTQVTMSDLLLNFTGTAEVKIGSTNLAKLENMLTNNAKPNIADMGGYQSIDLSYRAHKLTLPTV